MGTLKTALKKSLSTEMQCMHASKELTGFKQNGHVTPTGTLDDFDIIDGYWGTIATETVLMLLP